MQLPPPSDQPPLPGLALYYTEALQGVPHTLSKLVRNDSKMIICSICVKLTVTKQCKTGTREHRPASGSSAGSGSTSAYRL
jgi:hypothetical protein